MNLIIIIIMCFIFLSASLWLFQIDYKSSKEGRCDDCTYLFLLWKRPLYVKTSYFNRLWKKVVSYKEWLWVIPVIFFIREAIITIICVNLYLIVLLQYFVCILFIEYLTIFFFMFKNNLWKFKLLSPSTTQSTSPPPEKKLCFCF